MLLWSNCHSLSLCCRNDFSLSFSVYASAEDNAYVYTSPKKLNSRLERVMDTALSKMACWALEECWKKGQKVWCCSVQCSSRSSRSPIPIDDLQIRIYFSEKYPFLIL